jgi:hypothetical protein
MDNSRRARRVRLRPGLDELEDKCLLSQGTLGHLPRPAVEVHIMKAAHAQHTHKPHAPKAHPKPPPIPVINQKVVTFAEAHVGQKVGQGQCTDLVQAAYAAAGAESGSKLGPTGPDADYVWGTRVTTVTTSKHSLAGVVPGDVIQFHDVTLVHTTTYPNGSWSITTQTVEHHTAIVEAVSGSTIYVLEQNAGSADTPDSVRQTVQHGTFNLNDLQSGTMWIYQPISLG